MPVENNTHVLKSGGLAERAMRSSPAAVRGPYPPSGNTGGSLRHALDRKGNGHADKGGLAEPLAQSAPPSCVHVAQSDPPARCRASRTSSDMENFRDRWFSDWLTITIPNGTTGKGSCSPGDVGTAEAHEATARLMSWVTCAGLRLQRAGRGGDGYAGGASFAMDPTSSDTLAVVRAGHATNMPGLELRGGGGACADLAPKALAELGPVLIARADVSLDVSQEGLFDELAELARQTATENGMSAPRVDGTPGAGRTLYLGKGETSVRIYEKGFEMAAKGRIDPADIDPHLVRIEYVFRPRKGAKAGYARIARDEGVGALLGAVHWVRRMTEGIAVIAGYADDETATMAVTRIERTPDPRPVGVRAAHGARQYAGTFCRAAIAGIVAEQFGGDWLAAKVMPDAVEARAMDIVRRAVRMASHDACDAIGVLAVRDAEEEAVRAEQRLIDWIDVQEHETRLAQMALVEAEAAARWRAGVPDVVAA